MSIVMGWYKDSLGRVHDIPLSVDADGKLMIAGSVSGGGSSNVTIADGQTISIVGAVNAVGWHINTTGSDIFPDDAPTVFAYAGPNGQVSGITKTWGGSIFVKTFTYTGSNITADSGWVKQ